MEPYASTNFVVRHFYSYAFKVSMLCQSLDLIDNNRRIDAAATGGRPGRECSDTQARYWMTNVEPRPRYGDADRVGVARRGIRNQRCYSNR